ncbi:MAG: cytochrome P450 [Actinobacteria bacterium]|nr:cytochrome P450 [Actinomycetota bacterium]
MTVQSAPPVPLPRPPGNDGLPFIGRSLDFATGRFMASHYWYDNYGPISQTKAVGNTWINVEGPEGCGAVLQDRDKVYDASGWALMIGPFFNRGLMLLDGAEHHRHRRIMQEAFTTERLTGYLGPMNETISRGLAEWPGGRMLFHPAVKQLTLDVATRTFMADEIGAESERVNRAFSDAVRAPTAFVRVRVPGLGRLPWARGLDGRRLLENYLRPRVADHRAAEGSDLFSALCHVQSEDGERFTDDDVVNHMIFLLMAAHDTSTTTLTTMAYYLARYPEWQERCRSESVALDRDVVEYGDLERLPSLDLVMKESLRLVTPVPGLVRRANRETELLGYRVPDGAYVAVHLWGLHHMAEVWPDPERFDPERFAPHRHEDKVHRHAYLPFGNGIHKCIGMYFGGMEVKAAMHQLLLRYRITTDPGYRMPVDWVSLPRPKDGLPVRLHRR